MPYWLTNPDHGTMPVYDMGEVERCKQFGWTLLNVGESPIRVPVVNGDTSREPEDLIALPVVDAPPSVLYERDALVKAESLHEMRDESAPKRKPGRPPKTNKRPA